MLIKRQMEDFLQVPKVQEVTWGVNAILKGFAQLHPLLWRPFQCQFGGSAAKSALMEFGLLMYSRTY